MNKETFKYDKSQVDIAQNILDSCAKDFNTVDNAMYTTMKALYNFEKLEIVEEENPTLDLNIPENNAIACREAISRLMNSIADSIAAINSLSSMEEETETTKPIVVKIPANQEIIGQDNIVKKPVQAVYGAPPIENVSSAQNLQVTDQQQTVISKAVVTPKLDTDVSKYKVQIEPPIQAVYGAPPIENPGVRLSTNNFTPSENLTPIQKPGVLASAAVVAQKTVSSNSNTYKQIKPITSSTVNSISKDSSGRLEQAVYGAPPIINYEEK